MDIQLREITLKRFFSASPNGDFHLQDLGHLNVLIGPNNSGKSILSRLFPILRQALSRNKVLILEDSFWFKQESQYPIEIEIEGKSGAFTRQHLKVGEVALLNDGFWCAQMAILREAGLEPGSERSRLDLIPYYWVNGSKQISYLETTSGHSYLTQSGAYSDIPNISTDFENTNRSAVEALISATKIFAPIRDVQRAAAEGNAIDGSDIVRKLNELRISSKNALREKLRNIEATLNELLRPGLKPEISEMQVVTESREEGSKQIIQLTIGGLPVALSALGSGVAQLIILLSELILNGNKSAIYIIDEPENHLHPALLARLVTFLRTYDNVQFFLATHSNAILDCLGGNDRVFLLERDEEGKTAARPCKAFVEMHDILDALGIRASALLQANTVIWVEGPSDVIYIRYWLSVYTERADSEERLIENSDFSFLIYGGKMLNRFALDDVDCEDADGSPISMLRVCRRSAVLMDRDISPGQPEDKLRAAKRAILADAEKDSFHRWAKLTTGPEIENDFDIRLMLNALSLCFPRLQPELLALTPDRLNNSEKLPVQIGEALEWPEERQNKFKESFNRNKPALAECAIRLMKSEHTNTSEGSVRAEVSAWPDYIPSLAKFLLLGRKPDVRI